MDRGACWATVHGVVESVTVSYWKQTDWTYMTDPSCNLYHQPWREGKR